MDLQACQRISESFEAIAPHVGKMVDAFYRLLFERAPALRALFPQDMSRQQNHLGSALALVARNIAHLDLLREPLMLLGRQHIAYGARPGDYLIVRDAMLDALSEVAGSSFTAQLRADWFTTLNEVIAVMLQGVIAAAVEARARPNDAILMRSGSGVHGAGDRRDP